MSNKHIKLKLVENVTRKWEEKKKEVKWRGRESK